MKKICLRLGIILVLIAIVIVSILLVRAKTYKVQNPVATIQIEGYDNPIKVELDPQAAPDAVANFIKLSNNGYYTNCKLNVGDSEIAVDSSIEKAKLSNLIEDPQPDYVYGIKGDTLSNGYDNLLKNKKGSIYMVFPSDVNATSVADYYNSANAEFAISTKDNNAYDGYYAVFGNVIEGMEVIDAISGANEEIKEETSDGTVEINETQDTTADETENSTEESDEKTITIKSITVDTFGVDYGMPEIFDYSSKYGQQSYSLDDLSGYTTDGSAEYTIPAEE